MKWEEYLERYGKNVEGNIAYITDLRVSDGGNKFIRNIPPTKVLIRHNRELNGAKTIYYSDFHFLKMKGDKVLKQVIAPFDNTGYRYYTGTSVNIFEDYEDCVKKHNEQVEKAANVYNSRIREIEEQRDKLLQMKIEEED